MHPLRFPNSGIRAKTRGRGVASHDQPPYRSATHSQAAAKATQGQHAREAGAANRGSSLKGWPLRALQAVASLQGRQPPAGTHARNGGRLQGARKGLPPPASPTTSRGGGAGRRGVRY
ncbi:hypothetical protein BHE74_00053829 [Ensete ventricosum]|nr:hypothetical protein BHE74_00053829 [Ensete ventricosum]